MKPASAAKTIFYIDLLADHRNEALIVGKRVRQFHVADGRLQRIQGDDENISVRRFNARADFAPPPGSDRDISQSTQMSRPLFRQRIVKLCTKLGVLRREYEIKASVIISLKILDVLILRALFAQHFQQQRDVIHLGQRQRVPDRAAASSSVSLRSPIR